MRRLILTLAWIASQLNDTQIRSTSGGTCPKALLVFMFYTQKTGSARSVKTHLIHTTGKLR